MVLPVKLVLVVCGSPAHSKRPPRLARYAWSAQDDVWERVDQHGSDSEWFIGTNAEGTLQSYPRPEFPCPCGRREVYDHDTIQSMLHRAAIDGTSLAV
jgi:hypothetical protein